MSSQFKEVVETIMEYNAEKIAESKKSYKPFWSYVEELEVLFWFTNNEERIETECTLINAHSRNDLALENRIVKIMFSNRSYPYDTSVINFRERYDNHEYVSHTNINMNIDSFEPVKDAYNKLATNLKNNHNYLARLIELRDKIYKLEDDQCERFLLAQLKKFKDDENAMFKWLHDRATKNLKTGLQEQALYYKLCEVHIQTGLKTKPARRDIEYD